jgi:ribosomal protein S18 acetylase RimI-like enzyme
LPEGIREPLLHQQFRAQASGYTAQFPDALSIIVALNGDPAGRLVVDETADALHIVDVAFLPASRGGGAGSALLGALIRQAGATGRVVRLRVNRTNPGAARLYLRLGFKPVSQDAASTEMEWKKP